MVAPAVVGRRRDQSPSGYRAVIPRKHALPKRTEGWSIARGARSRHRHAQVRSLLSTLFCFSIFCFYCVFFCVFISLFVWCDRVKFSTFLHNHTLHSLHNIWSQDAEAHGRSGRSLPIVSFRSLHSHSLQLLTELD